MTKFNKSEKYQSFFFFYPILSLNVKQNNSTVVTLTWIYETDLANIESVHLNAR